MKMIKYQNFIDLLITVYVNMIQFRVWLKTNRVILETPRVHLMDMKTNDVVLTLSVSYDTMK